MQDGIGIHDVKRTRIGKMGKFFTQKHYIFFEKISFFHTKHLHARFAKL